ncbi:hypothetical protein BAVI_07366 [Neobacillus vireti LMG 21834]|uniref:Uncharacterized protein n=2 Tax=Neobacillus TaxID=2675232 RepID=A0AB94IQP9_9BACI|nr:hypothetical protein BAVI_07366 [Neobacillus vireti LMG 21834]
MAMHFKKTDFLKVIAVLLIYTTVGYLMNVDVLKIFIIRTDEFSISIFGVVLWVLTFIFIQYIGRYFSKTKGNR